jgi:hypothetical protein
MWYNLLYLTKMRVGCTNRSNFWRKTMFSKRTMTLVVVGFLLAIIGYLWQQQPARGDELVAAQRWLASSEAAAKREAIVAENEEIAARHEVSASCKQLACKQAILQGEVSITVASACFRFVRARDGELEMEKFLEDFFTCHRDGGNFPDLIN